MGYTSRQNPNNNRDKNSRYSPFGNVGEVAAAPVMMTPEGQVVSTDPLTSPYAAMTEVPLQPYENPILEQQQQPFSFGAMTNQAVNQPFNPYAAVANAANIPTFSNYDPNASEYSSSLGEIVPSNGKGTVYYRDKTPGFFQKDGHKNEVTNNPGNITGGHGKLLFGATGRLLSKYNGQDASDSNILVYPDAKAGFRAMDQQMRAKRYNGPIKTAFAQWQKHGFEGKLAKLRKAGVNPNKSYKQLTPEEQAKMRKVWAIAEGWRKKEFY
jgi:hypothetical protein